MRGQAKYAEYVNIRENVKPTGMEARCTCLKKPMHPRTQYTDFMA